MRRFLFFILIEFCVCLSSFADTTIQMEEYNGVYRIPCTVNGAKMKFIFDTGASNVCLSMTMAEYLYDNGYIDTEDILGIGSSSVADGRIVDHIRINLRDIELSGVHLYNVEAVVIDGQNAPLLMGQSAIQKLGNIEMKGSLLIIKNDMESNEDYIAKLFEEAYEAYDNDLFEKAVEKYGILYQMKELSDYGLYVYAISCLQTNNPQKALSVLNDVKSYDYFEENKIDIYSLLGLTNQQLGKYKEAISYFDLSSNKIQTEPKEWILNVRAQGDCYYDMGSYSLAAEKYRQAIAMIAYVNGVDIKYLQHDCKNELKKKQKSFRDDNLDYLFFYLIECDERSGAWDTEGFMLEAAAFARAGNKYAMQMFNSLGIDPYSRAWKP